METQKPFQRLMGKTGKKELVKWVRKMETGSQDKTQWGNGRRFQRRREGQMLPRGMCRKGSRRDSR